MKKTAAVLCAALLTLTACGSGEDEEAKEAIKASVLDEQNDVAGMSLTDEQADCFADGLVDDIGVEQLQEYELLNEDYEIIQDAQPKDMSEEDADALAAVITDCVDMAEMIQDQINQNAQTELTDEQAQCITDALDEETIRAGLSAEFQGETTDPMEDMTGAMMECVMGDLGAE